MQKKTLSIKRQITILLAAIIGIILIIEATILYSNISTRRSNMEQELETLTKQLENNIDIFCNDIESVVDNIYNSPKMQLFFIEDNDDERYVISQYVHDIMNATIYGNLSIASLRIFQENYVFNAAGQLSQQDVFLQVDKDYGLFDLNPDRPIYSKVYWDEGSMTPYMAYIRPAYPVGQSVEDLSNKKVFYALVRMDRLQQYVDSLSSSVTGLKVFVSNEDGVILSNRNGKLGVSNTSMLKSNKYLSLSNEVDRVGWSIDIGLSVSDVYANIFSGLKENLIIAGLAIIILWSLGMWISYKLTTPVMSLAEDISYISDENATLNKSYGLQEIDTVALYVDSMLDRVKTTNENLMDAQTRLHQSLMLKKEAELAFFQTQINPHFLYNTLECMRSIGQAYNVDEVQIISAAMARIFRYSIKSRDKVSASEEINCAREYYEIVKIRYLSKYLVSFEIDEALYSCKVSKMILQPLIENAIAHGLSGKDEGGLILVTAFEKDDKFYLCVTDDGVGMSEKKLKRVQDGLPASGVKSSTGRKGIALNNINSRIKLDFGEEYGMDISSAEGLGTTVTLVFPTEFESGFESLES